jgi:hypothetical protein
MFLALYRGTMRSLFRTRNGLLQLFDFRRLQSAIPRLIEIAEIERAELHTPYFFHRMIECKQRTAQQIAPRVADLDFVPRICGVRPRRSRRAQ